MQSKRDLNQLKSEFDSLTGSAAAPSESEPKTGGRHADGPTEIPPSGWMDVAWRTWSEVSDANLFLVAGGVTYAILLALFPALAAGISLYGLVADPIRVERQLGALGAFLPEQAMKMLTDQLHSLISASTGTLGFSAILGSLVALWSASRGMSGVISALNIAYQQKETRSFIRLNLFALLLTLILMVGGLIIITFVAVIPAAVQLLPIGRAAKWVVLVFEWPLLVVVMLSGLAALYRFAPARDKPKWRWVSPGALTATVLWVAASIGFTVYVTNFNSYDRTYGSLGGVVILMTWLYISALVVLLGAVINAQSELQTYQDSTSGPSRPIGLRGAHVADTVGSCGVPTR